MNRTETNIYKAKSLQDMQQIAKNQMYFRALELQEMAKKMMEASKQVESVTTWDAYLDVTDDIGDDEFEFKALSEIGQYYEDMKPGGGYFG